jgi:hypothetical protein
MHSKIYENYSGFYILSIDYYIDFRPFEHVLHPLWKIPNANARNHVRAR